jgi:hypothetical protein
LPRTQLFASANVFRPKCSAAAFSAAPVLVVIPREVSGEHRAGKFWECSNSKRSNRPNRAYGVRHRWRVSLRTLAQEGRILSLLTRRSGVPFLRLRRRHSSLTLLPEFFDVDARQPSKPLDKALGERIVRQISE